MPKRRSRLTNCYVPATIRSLEEEKNHETFKSNWRFQRGTGQVNPSPPDGQSPTEPQSQLRSPLSMRPIMFQTLNPSTTATASTYTELGRTKVLCRVQAPIPSHRVPSQLLPLPTDRGVLHCQVTYAPHISYHTSVASSVAVILPFESSALVPWSTLSMQQQRQTSQWMEAREAHCGRSLQNALADAIVLEDFAHSVIGVFVTVIQDDGGALEMAIAAASMALAQAQVPLRDLVVAVQVSIVDTFYSSISSDRENDKLQQQQQLVSKGKKEAEKDVEKAMDMDPSSNENRSTDASNDETDSRFLICVDPSEDELLYDPRIVATLCMAWMPNRKLVTLWEQHPRLSYRRPNNNNNSNNTQTSTIVTVPPSIMEKAIQACRQACTKILLPRLRQSLLEQQEQSPAEASPVEEQPAVSKNTE